MARSRSFAKRTNYRFLSVATGFSAARCCTCRSWRSSSGHRLLVLAYGSHGALDQRGVLLSWNLLIGISTTSSDRQRTLTSKDQERHRFTTLPLPPDFDAIASDPARAAPGPRSSRSRRRGSAHGAVHGVGHCGSTTSPRASATFLAALEDPSVGTAIAIAIALHNIPEGISVSVPIFYATGNRRKAFVYASLSGLTEPVGAILAYVGLRFLVGGESCVIPSEVMGILFGGVAGIMVYISLDELLPTSRAYGKGHDSLFGLLAGMAVMALSLLLMK